jgi:hypothetical protein
VAQPPVSPIAIAGNSDHDPLETVITMLWEWVIAMAWNG